MSRFQRLNSGSAAIVERRFSAKREIVPSDLQSVFPQAIGAISTGRNSSIKWTQDPVRCAVLCNALFSPTNEGRFVDRGF